MSEYDLFYQELRGWVTDQQLLDLHAWVLEAELISLSHVERFDDPKDWRTILHEKALMRRKAKADRLATPSKTCQRVKDKHDFRVKAFCERLRAQAEANRAAHRVDPMITD